MSTENKVSVDPYLNFPGNCEEAMTFYKEALNGNLEMMRFEGSPVEVDSDYKQKILHSTLSFGDAKILASDGMKDAPPTMGNHMHISISTPSEEVGKRYFDNLSDGGTIIMPFAEVFWGGKFGMLTDKFGVGWMVSAAYEQG